MSAPAATTIAVLTGGELRHTFLRMALGVAPGLDVLVSGCEGSGRSLRSTVGARADATPLERQHVEGRERSERDFFGAFVRLTEDRSSPEQLDDRDVNDPRFVDEVLRRAPQLLAAFGCALVREPLLSRYAGRFVNLHLGLSPYYRGAGTNFWPLVNGEPEYVGATFLHLDAGVDTGEIIHQIRARIFPGDTPHQIGNRLIADAAVVYAELLRRFAALDRLPQPTAPTPRVYRRAAAAGQAVARLYAQFDSGLVDTFLSERDERVGRVPIVEQPLLAGVAPT